PCPCCPLLPAPRRDDPPQPTPHSQALDDTAGTISTLTSDAVPAHPRVSQQRERAVACDLRWSQPETETRSAITARRVDVHSAMRLPPYGRQATTNRYSSCLESDEQLTIVGMSPIADSAPQRHNRRIPCSTALISAVRL